MVNELDSFLQFIAAICFTIALDASVFQRFWNADYYGIINRCISKYKIVTSTPKEKDLNKFVVNHQRAIEAKGRMQGTFLLLVICLLIVYGLFECTFVEKEELHNIAISIVLIVTFIVALFVSFDSRKKVLLCWIITVGLLLVLTYLSCYLSKHYDCSIDITFSKIFLRASLILSIGIPVGFRFFYNSLYTNRYPIYLENLLYNERELYETAKNAIKHKKKDMLPSKYEKAFSAAYMDQQKNASKEEDIVAICTDIYYQQIEQTVNEQPSFFQLLKKQDTLENIRSKVEETNSIPQQNKVLDDDLLKAVKEYEQLRVKPKMKDFCVKIGIDYDIFKTFRDKIGTSSLKSSINIK